nr:LLM class flavin-dependent oxidoreductase [Nonomuraea sp. FMUSA5-5]
MRSGLWLPLFDDLADPLTVARLAADAEEAGWDGCFVWDHLHWRAPVRQVADPWIALAAIATATERLRLGPMVSPLARRRPAKVARETATLDRLSGGRLVLGVGLGSDRFGGELSRTGEQLDDRRRGRMLDESLTILAAAWSGEPVRHRGERACATSPSNGPTPRSTPSRRDVSPWGSAGSARCSSPARSRRSPTSGGRCGRGRGWCGSCGRPASARSGSAPSGRRWPAAGRRRDGPRSRPAAGRPGRP